MANQQEVRVQQCGEKCKVDYLTVRLRRMVRAVMADERNAISSSAFVLLRDKQQHIVRRLVSGVAILICFTLFLCQTFNRVSFYFEFPVTTDVFIRKQTYQTFPDVTICYPQTKGMLDFCKERRISAAFYFSVYRLPSLVYDDKRTLAQIWEMLKTSTTITSAKTITKTSSENLTFWEVLLLDGTCATFHRSSNISAKTDHDMMKIVFPASYEKCAAHAASVVYIHENGEEPNFRREHIFGISMRNEIEIEIRKFSFVNRTNEPCISYEDYRSCKKDCFSIFASKHALCRFPYIPTARNLTDCTADMNRFYNSEKLKLFFVGGGIESLCECTRKCNHRTFEEKIVTNHLTTNQTIYIVKFGDPHETEIAQRRVYDIVNLLADIGGNSGFFIGVSILSLCDFFASFQRKRKPSKFSPTDPLFIIVLKTYKKFGLISTFKKAISIKTNFPVLVRRMLLALCLSLLMLAVVYRIVHFVKRPFRHVVDISFNTTADHPSLTICGGDPVVLNLQEKFASKNNISDPCKVKVWELLNLPKVQAKMLWNTTTPHPSPKFWQQFKMVNLHDGTCYSFDHGNNPVPAENSKWFGSYIPSLCGTNYQKIYIKPATGYYDYFLYRYILLNRQQQISFNIKEIIIDKSVEPCVIEENHESCINNCRMRKLRERSRCRLPYMDDERLPLCNSSTSAKHFHLYYLELLLPGTTDDCNCLPPCRKRFYETIEKVTEQQDYLSFNFGPSHNIIQSYMTQPSYSIEALVSDIGGFIGTTLGLCVLDIMEMLTSKIYAKSTRLNNLTKRGRW